MKRGEKESFCLEKVKMEMFSDLTNDALNENPHYNLDFDKNYFGLLEDERAEFVNIIREAKPNPSSSEFPDFIFADGFIICRRCHILSRVSKVLCQLFYICYFTHLATVLASMPYNCAIWYMLAPD